MHRPDESLDWTEKNIDMQMLRSFWPKLEKIRQLRVMSTKKRRRQLFFFSAVVNNKFEVIN